MRYWQHNETGRLLAVDIQMAPSNWTQITKEQYEEAKAFVEQLKNLETGRIKSS
jgi:hypothetical protein